MKAIIFVLLIIALAVGGYNAAFLVDDGEFGVVTGLEGGEVVAVLHPGFNFAPQALFPWKVAVDYQRVKSTEMLDVRVPLPGLDELDNRHYSVGLRMNVVYEIDYETVPGELVAEKGMVRKAIERLMKGGFTREISTYLYPVYDNMKLEKEFNAVAERAFSSVKKQCAAMGIRMTGQDLVGTVSIPNVDIYREGANLAGEIRKIENDSRKELLVLENKLQKEDFNNKKYLENLKEIAKLVKNNPDLLKYLYIKGFSKNVRAIITSERSGMPFGLEFEGKGESRGKSGDVDNLR